MTNTWQVEVTTSTNDALKRGVAALPRHPGGPDFTVVHIAADAAASDTEAMILAAHIALATSGHDMPTSTTLISWPTS